MAPTYLPDLAYLLVTQYDVATNPNIPPVLGEELILGVYDTAAVYAAHVRDWPTFTQWDARPHPRPRLVHWSDLDEIVRHARKTVSDSFADGWLPKDATTPF